MINIHLQKSISSQINRGIFQFKQVPNGFAKYPCQGNGITFFNHKKANTLQADISLLDREIDQLLNELYGLTKEEIKIMEGGEG